MRVCALLLLVACVSCVVAQVTMDTPYVVGSTTFGYTMAIGDGADSIILATNPANGNQARIIKAAVGQSGEPSGPDSGQVALDANKGSVTCGCIANVSGVPHLFAGMSSAGFVTKLRLDFTEGTPTASYLSTDNDNLWFSGPIQTFSSAVCQGNYVYFGTDGGLVSSTVVRLDVTDTNSETRFSSLGSISTTALTLASEWGDDAVIFASESDGADSPLSFFTVLTNGQFTLQSEREVHTPLDSFTALSGMAADATTQKVVIGNGVGSPAVALIDLSLASRATVEQHLVLSEQSTVSSPITSFAVDEDARYAYVTTGTCDTTTALVSVRLVPSLAVELTTPTDTNTFDCATSGIPANSVLITSEDDTLVAPAQPRQLLVFTLSDATDGAVIPYTVFGAGPCEDDCGSQLGHGECAGESCHCYPAWLGSTCTMAAPCGGTMCNDHGVCGNNGCTCEVGWTGKYCATSVPCPFLCSGHGSCLSLQCECDAGYTGLGCELQTVGCESKLNCNDHGVCTPSYPEGFCTCEPGFVGDDCGVADTTCADSTCSGNGVCSAGLCVCTPGFTGPDCSVSTVPCPNNCSSHGVCRNSQCSCFDGFTGSDCGTVDESFCPGCSGYGTCVANVCVCAEGWKGPNCTEVERDLRVMSEFALQAGENHAATSFSYSITDDAFVVCLMTSPGKCVTFDPTTMERKRAVTFDDASDGQLLFQDSPASAKAGNNALVPDAVAMVDLGAFIGAAPISVSVVEDTPNGFAILGSKLLGNGIMHGQLLKISLATMERVAALEFDDDNGNGVTAGCRGGDDSFFFASGSSPSILYHVGADLSIKARVAVDDAPTSATEVLVYDGERYLVAATRNTVYVYEVTADSIQTISGVPPLVLPGGLGGVTTGFIDTSQSVPCVYLGTDSSPGTVVKMRVTGSRSAYEALVLNSGEDRVTTSLIQGSFAYLGLGTTGTSCSVVKLDLSGWSEYDSVDLKNCDSDLSAASVSADGNHAHFSNAASPAHVYTVRLVQMDTCPDDCSGNGVCRLGVCTCSAGWTGNNCATKSCPNQCSSHGTCVDGFCQCETGYFGYDCAETPVCVDTCVHGTCVGNNSFWPCQCQTANWAGLLCDVAVCPTNCSGHGVCTNGVCDCDTNYAGGDCAIDLTVPVSERGCASNEHCGVHGVCEVASDGTGTCTCAEGWTGLDCDIDSDYRNEVTTTKISPFLIAMLVLGALLFGMVAGVMIWKSWLGQTTDPGIAGLAGPQPSSVAVGGYTRLPRRLVK